MIYTKTKKNKDDKEIVPYSKEWLNPDELQKILSMPDIPEKYEVWMLLLYSPALRVSEALNVRVRDIDIKNKCIEIWNAKGVSNNDLRKAPITSDAIKRIMRYVEHQKLKDNDYIMFSNKSKQVSRSHVYVVVGELCKQAGVDKCIGTHTFRRSRAQHLLDAGVPLISVSRYLRHKSIETTMHYLHYSIDDLQKELTKYDEPFQML
jgi:integrase/recombinase XerD